MYSSGEPSDTNDLRLSLKIYIYSVGELEKVFTVGVFFFFERTLNRAGVSVYSGLAGKLIN